MSHSDGNRTTVPTHCSCQGCSLLNPRTTLLKVDYNRIKTGLELDRKWSKRLALNQTKTWTKTKLN